MVLSKELVVGGPGCSYQEIVDALEKSNTVYVLHSNILKIGKRMRLQDDDFFEIEKQLCSGNIKTFDALYKFLEHWRSLKSSEAKLETFVNILVECGLNDCADAVRNKFSDSIDNNINTYNASIPGNVINVREDSLKPMAGDNELLESQKTNETTIKIDMPEVLFDYTYGDEELLELQKAAETPIYFKRQDFLDSPLVDGEFSESQKTTDATIKINMPEVIFDYSYRKEELLDLQKEAETPIYFNLRQDFFGSPSVDGELFESQKTTETTIKINMPEVIFDYTYRDEELLEFQKEADTPIYYYLRQDFLGSPSVDGELLESQKKTETPININMPEVLFDYTKTETHINIPETDNINRLLEMRKLKNSKYKRIACIFLIHLGVLVIIYGLFLLAYFIVTQARQSNLPTYTNESSSLIHTSDAVETIKIYNDFADGNENFRVGVGPKLHVIINASTSPKLIYNSMLSNMNTIILDSSESNHDVCTSVGIKEKPGADEILRLTNLQKFVSFGELCSDIYNMLLKNVIFWSISEVYLTYTKGSEFSLLLEKMAADSPSTLKSLEIANLCTADFSSAFTSTFPTLQSLTTLIISCNSFQPEYVDDDETLWDILKRFPNLTHLGLRNLIISESLYRRLAKIFKLVKIEVGIQVNSWNFDMNSLPLGTIYVKLYLRFPFSNQNETVPTITSMNQTRRGKMETCTVKSNFERHNHSCKDFDYTEFA